MLEAAVLVSTKDDVRPALTGVCIREREGVLEVAATNGHMLFVQRPKVEKRPAWAKNGGVVIERELLLKLAKLQKEGGVSLGYGKNHRHVTGTTSPDFARFKLPVIDSPFPDYGNILVGGARALAGGDVAPLSAVTLDPAYVKIVGQIGAILEAKGVSTFLSHEGTPSVFTFGEASASALYVMPLAGGASIGAATMKLLAPALRGTLAALKAHVTRAKQAEKSAKNKSEEAAAKKKREDLEARLAAVTAAGVAKLEDKRAA